MSSLEEMASLRDQFPGIEQGVVVITLEPGGPAFEGDLQAGDLITAVDGVSLRRSHDLARYVQRRKVGDTVQLAVWRKGQTLTLPLKTGELQPDVTRVAVPRTTPAPEDIGEAFGLQLEDFHGSGAKVVSVIPHSPASKTELRAHDVITDINAEEVAGASAAREKLKAAAARAPGKGVLINFSREGKKSWVVIERPSH
jgi:serine protease Do